MRGWGARASRVALLGLCLSAPPAAQAQEPGVFVDPDSPAGIEYSIPLTDTRDRGSRGTGGSDATGGGHAQPGGPLFGVGIGDGEPAGKSGPGSGGSGAEGHRGDDRAGSAGDVPGGAPGTPTSVAAVPQGGAGMSVLVAAMAAIVVLAGTLLGVWARRRSAA